MLIFSGCTTAKDSSETQANNLTQADISIPFITYYNEQDNKIAARLSYWDLTNSKIDFTDNIMYTSIPTPHNDFVEPVVWNGREKLVLHKIGTPEGGYREKAEVIENYTLSTIYGRDIEAKMNINSDGLIKDFDLFLYNENEVVEKKAAFLCKTKDNNNNEIIVGEQDIPSFIDYDNKTGEVTFIYKYPFETYFNIYVGKCNINDIEKIKWDEIKLDKAIETGGTYTPYPNNSMLVGSKYYIQSHLSLAVVDLEKKESKVLDSIAKRLKTVVKEGSFNPGFPKDIIPVGIYEDILILSVPISTDTNVDYLICALKNNEFLGAIHIENDDVWNIIDSKNNVKTEINVKGKNLFKKFNKSFIYFPFMSNIM